MKPLVSIVIAALAVGACASVPETVAVSRPEARSYHVSENASADVVRRWRAPACRASGFCW